MATANHAPPDAIVAVPLFGEEIAPRFCASEDFLIVDVDCGTITKRSRISLADIGWVERLSRLAERGVTVLLCGGLNRRFVPSAERKGIQVTTFLAGNADEVVAAYLRGDVDDYRFPRRQRRDADGRRRNARDGAHCAREDYR